MGLAIGEGNPKPVNIGGGNESNKISGLKIDRMSTNVILIMDSLARYESIFDLLIYEDDKPLNHSKSEPIFKGDLISAQEVFEKKYIRKPLSKYQRIFPTPFNVEAITNDKVFIRVYYGRGSFDGSGTISEHQLNIDIICAKDYWEITDTARKLPIIRPYAIMARLIEVLSGESGIEEVKLGTPSGFNHLSVNSKFECLRVYYDTFEVR